MDTRFPYSNPEIWGGAECSIVRINDEFRDQLAEMKCYARFDDVSLFQSTGIRRIRFPILWERHQPTPHHFENWEATARRLQGILDAGIDPILGLLHHGSGPDYSNLLDEDFPVKLARFAVEVAKRNPEITDYTPVNEPLTTARFSGLYGHWYPHHYNELSFFRMLLNQLKGVVLSMQAIRTINPSARLIQTEDLAYIQSTAKLSYQAEFENERRWLSFDILCGRVGPHHFFWNYLLDLGIEESALRFFLEHPTPPSILGLDYYITSERYLDDALAAYPAHMHGGNGRDSYVDIAAVHTGQMIGLKSLLLQTGQRYGLPMAITECTLACTREEQMRWLKETWDSAVWVNRQGYEVRGVTAWAMFGAMDWNSLLTRRDLHYEPGVYDLTADATRPTALARMVRALSDRGDYHHPLLEAPGWWHPEKDKNTDQRVAQKKNSPPLLIIGRHGTLAQAFIRLCKLRGIHAIAFSREELNVLDADAVRRMIEEYRPWGLVNCAGYVNVDEAERQPGSCFELNTTAPTLLGEICASKGIRMLTFSSDLVFDGEQDTPYGEGDHVNPLNVYGISKAKAEDCLARINPTALILRSSCFFGPWDRYNFPTVLMESIRSGKPLPVPVDVMVSPTYVPDLVNAALDLFIDEEQGIWHIANIGEVTWSDFAKEIAQRARLSPGKINMLAAVEMPWLARRPKYSAIASNKGVRLPALHAALDRFFTEAARSAELI